MSKKNIQSKAQTSNENSSKKSYSLFIDSYENGIFHGWAINDQDINAPVNIELFIENTLIGSGKADIYRQDLRDAGVGNGYHGFSIRATFTGVTSGRHTVKALCDQNYIADETFPLNLKDTTKIYIDDVSAMTVGGRFKFDSSVQSTASYQILIDENIIHTGTINQISNEEVKFYCRIPEKFFDGNPHVITTKMLEDQASSTSIVKILTPILTPWSYFLKEKDANSNYYSGLPSMVARRLSALSSHIEANFKSGDYSDLKQAYTAYEILNEEFKKRDEYPTLNIPTAKGKPLISIIIPVHNNFSITYHCLASFLLYKNSCNYEIIIVDDASTDNTSNIKKFINNITVLKNKNNIGFLKSCNAAAKIAKGEYLVFLNNDTEIGNHCLDEMIDVFNRFEKVGLVGCKLIYPNGILQEAGGIIWENGEPWNLGKGENPMLPEWNYVRQTDYVSGAAIMISKSLWNSVDGFSEEFAPCYFEDADLAFKVRGLGYKVIYTPHAEIVHFEGMSNGTDIMMGLKKHQMLNQPLFSSKWIAKLENNGPVGADLWKNKERGVRYRALVIDYQTPQPDKDAGSYAEIQEISLLQSHGFKVTFIPENLAHFAKYTRHLQKMGVECIHAPFVSSVEEFLKKRGLEFDLIYITRFHVAEKYLDLIKKYSKAKTILNNADLHFLRELRRLLNKGDKQLSSALETRDKELSTMNKVDAILSYNESEHAVITSHILKSDNIFKCPWIVPALGNKNTFKQRSGIAFLGGYNHFPNVEAVEFLVGKIMPALGLINPKIKLYIYGSNSPESFKEYASENIEIVGYADSLEAIFEKHRIFVAPLLSGAGLKGKVIEAMSWGMPVIVSPIAIEATGLIHGISTLLAESPNDWVRSILKLHDDEILWDKLSKNSLELAKTAYSYENARRLFAKPLNYLGFYS